jgi:hypothetical protein
MGLLQQIMQRRQNHKDHEPVGEYTLVRFMGGACGGTPSPTRRGALSFNWSSYPAVQKNVAPIGATARISRRPTALICRRL